MYQFQNVSVKYVQKDDQPIVCRPTQFSVINPSTMPTMNTLESGSKTK